MIQINGWREQGSGQARSFRLLGFLGGTISKTQSVRVDETGAISGSGP
jgi:hypothetical protein